MNGLLVVVGAAFAVLGAVVFAGVVLPAVWHLLIVPYFEYRRRA